MCLALSALNEAFLNHDPEAFQSLSTQDVVFIASDEVEDTVGHREPVEAMWEAIAPIAEVVQSFTLESEPVNKEVGNLALLAFQRVARARLSDRTFVSAPVCSQYEFTLTEHDAARPWIVVRQEHRTVTLDAGLNFFEWAHSQWPAPR